MNVYVADTHALYWYLLGAPRLSLAARQAFTEADNGSAIIYVPAIVMAELQFLNKKHGDPLDFTAAFTQLAQNPQFVLSPFEAEHVLDFTSHAAAAEMHDRIIVGVALRLGVPCITCDKNIIASNLVNIVW
ncbi:MAG: PIN domain-containing protein [Acidobacteriota bacterium]